MTRKCSINDCDNKHYGRGFCAAHWTRWKRHGDPLAGRTLVGKGAEFVEKAIRFVGDECLEWPYSKKTGYGRVWVDGVECVAHRVVLQRTQGPPPSPDMQAAHAPVICHNRACVNPKHLRWATVSDNHADKIEDGTHRRGERTPGSKLTAADVLAIRVDSRKGCDIAKAYGVSEAAISLIRSGRNWSWLDEKEVAA